MHDIVIIGSGYAGVWALKAAADAARRQRACGRLRIALVAPEPALVARPRLYEADLTDAQARIPLAPIFEATGADYIGGRVDAVEVGAPGARLMLSDRRIVEARALVVAAGSTTRRPAGLTGVHDIDGVETAAVFWRDLRAALDRTTGRRVSLVVAGAGLTGIEAATEAAVRFGGRLDVHLVDRAATLEGWSPSATTYIRARLDRLGISLHLGTGVAGFEAGHARLSSGDRIRADLLLWTAGMGPSALAGFATGARMSDGRVMVDRYLRQAEAPGLFWAGDVAAAPTPEHGVTIMSCQYAMPMGTVAGRNAVHHLAGEALEPFEPRPYVTCLALGPDDALFTHGREREPRQTGAAAVQVKKYIVEAVIIPAPDAAEAA